jgi:hypothetical protein
LRQLKKQNSLFSLFTIEPLVFCVAIEAGFFNAIIVKKEREKNILEGL